MRTSKEKKMLFQIQGLNFHHFLKFLNHLFHYLGEVPNFLLLNVSDSDKKVGTTTKKKKTQQTQVENTNNGLSDQCEMKEVEQSGNSAKKKNKKKKNKETKMKMIESHLNSEVETGEKKDEE